VQVPENRLPEFTDDMQLASLETAVAANLKYLRTREPLETALFGGQEYSVADLIRTQVFFLKLLAERPAPDTLNQRIRENFDVFQAAGTGGINLRRNMLVTGYYQPVFEGSLHKEEPFLHPIYSVPPDLVRQKTPAGKYTVGRLEDGRLVPYWSRAEIELDGRAAGSEIAWLKDPFDAFVLHVQGSGLIRLRDGSLRSIHFAAKNGHPYRSIGRYMVRTGRMSLADAGMQTIRKYLADNPGERREILHHNPSFIFFDWSSTRGAVGNLGRELTGGRSIAVDQQCFPSGALAFLFTRKPTAEGEEFGSRQPLHRFVVVQDTGSAIRGPGRVDLYWGTGKEAGERAGRMKEPGRLYFFILKDEEPVSEPADRG
jgi:membrane-bound lytic murein transglycosylase A